MSSADQTAPPDSWAVPEAEKAIKISLVPPHSFPASSKTESFNPRMTYQLFEGEGIYGYKNLNVNLKFRQDDMSSSLSVKYDQKLAVASSSTAPDNDLKVDDVEGVLRGCLPDDTADELDLSESHFTPPGEPVNTYFRDETKFQIYRANFSDPRARELVRRTEILVLFFIEAGSTIDFDEDWVQNRWDLFTLYQILPDDKVSFIGFCTVYKNWYFTPGTAAITPANQTNGDTTDKATQFLDSINQGTDYSRSYRARISQFIILPPYQGNGHAKELYNTIIKTYLPDPELKEITVEDPSERFEDIRDIADYRRLTAANLITPDVVATLLQRGKKATLWLETQRQVAKMPRRQFMRIVEMCVFEAILNDDNADHVERHKFEVYVKERIYRHNKDILMQLERPERSEKLNETYANVEDDYIRLLRILGSSVVEKLIQSDDNPVTKVIAGKRQISTIQEDEEEGAQDEDEEMEELEPPSKKTRTA
ncbi:hypothetical protein ABW21_db0204733 [Orbilia brochopaga]|nr:hypothetical protein ABW21_db0204733 [Drechslerella brochopaga]